MGGDLKMVLDGKAPTFLVPAIRDADDANLDRIQMIKGWLDGGSRCVRADQVAGSGDG